MLLAFFRVFLWFFTDFAEKPAKKVIIPLTAMYKNIPVNFVESSLKQVITGNASINIFIQITIYNTAKVVNIFLCSKLKTAIM
jgi:hypothetical protein